MEITKKKTKPHKEQELKFNAYDTTNAHKTKQNKIKNNDDGLIIIVYLMMD